MSEGELKKRIIDETVVDSDDIKQSVEVIGKDRVLQIELPEDKYMIRLKDLFKILDEAKKEFPRLSNPKYHMGTYRLGDEEYIPYLPVDYPKYVGDVLKWVSENFGDEK